MKNYSVLIVDNSPIITQALSNLLPFDPEITISGFCSDGCQVMDYLKNNSVDTIIMDVQMESLDGIETTKIVHQTFPHINIIGFSTFDDNYTKLKMLEEGANYYLNKGCDLEVLLDAIKSQTQPETTELAECKK